MLATPGTVTANRRVFLTPPLTAPVRLSGTPVVQLDASADKTSTHLGAILVDFGPAFPRVNRATGDGVQTLTTSDCWGQASAADNGCYKDVGERIDTTTTRVAGVQGRARRGPPHVAADARPRSSPASATRSASRCCRTTTRSRPGTRSAS